MTYGDNYWRNFMRRRLSRRQMMRGVAVGGLGLAAAAAIGCGEDEETGPTPTATGTGTQPAGTGTATATGTPAAGTPKRGGTTVMALGNFTDLDPHTNLNQGIWVWNILSNLIIYNDGPSFKPDPQLSLAESWEIPGDGMEIILKLRQGVKWHNKPPTNGREVTAEDIAFNLMRIAGKLDPQNIARYQRASNLVNMNRAEAVDATTIRVVMDAPSSAFISGVADWRNSIVPEELVEIGFQDATRFVGTGPFTMERWEDNGQRAEFKKNPDYWERGADGQPLPYIDSIRWNYLPDRATNISAFISKDIDWILAPSRTERQTIGSAFRDAVLYQWSYGNWNHFRLNTTRRPFDDARVRRALHLALNYKEIGDAYYGEGFWEFTGALNAGFPEAIPSAEIAQMPGWNPATKQQDIERAKQLMSEAGYPDGAFSFKILQSSNATTGFGYEASVRAQDHYKSIWPGMTIEIDLPPDGATFATRQAQSDFDALAYINFPFADAVLDMTAQYHTKGSRNYGRFSNSEIDAGLEAALVELNLEKRAQMLRELQLRIINEFMPILTTSMPKYLVYGNPRIKGFEGHSGPGSLGAYDIVSFADRYWIA